MTYRRDIDGLRALAILPVILFHAGFQRVPGGYVGVDVFFVISGFLITGIIKPEMDSGRFSLIRFYERRARRILPAFFVVTAAVAAAGGALMLPDDYKSFAASAIAATFFVSNIFFRMQSDNYFDAPAETKPLLHTWSLSVEEQYYLFFPIFLLLLALVFSRYRKSDASIVRSIAAVGFLSFLWATWAAYYEPLSAFYPLPARAWEPMLGSLLALGAFRPLRFQWQAEAAALCGVGLILFAVFFYSRETLFPGLGALPPALGAALILHAGLDGRTSVAARALGLQPLRFIGLISYSLYLWHWPVIVFSRSWLGADVDATVLAGALSLSFVLAALTWRYVEQPFRTRRDVFTRRRIFALSGVAMAIVSLLALDAISDSGRTDLHAILERSRYEDPRFHECHNPSDRPLEPRPPCLRGAAGREASFVLVGDSHASQLAVGIFKAAENAGLAGYQVTAGGWRPTGSYVRVSREREHRAMQAQFETVLADPAVERVVIVVFWKAALELPYVREGRRVDGAPAVVEGLRALIVAHPEKQFVLLEDTPAAKAFGVRELARSIASGKAFDPKIPVEDFRRERDRVAEVLAPLAEFPNVEWASISDALCDEAFCHGQRGGETLYFDNDHLTSQFAESNVEVMARVFGSAAARSLRNAERQP